MAATSVITFNQAVSLLRQHAETGNAAQGRRLHAHIRKQGMDGDTFLGNLLVQMYSSCGCVGEARAAFDRIREPNVYSWTILLAAYAEGGDLQRARSVFDQMPVRNVVSWTCMLTAYAQDGHLQEACKLFAQMPQRSVVSWNAIISGHAQNGQAAEALQMYRYMLLEGQKPNAVTFVSTANACAILKDLAAASTVLLCIAETGLDRSNARVGNVLINLYGECGWTSLLVAFASSGRLQDAEFVFHRMPEKSVVCWTAMISALAQAGRNQEALLLFKQMDLEGERPDHVAFVAIFDVCSKLPALEEGLILYEEMKGTDAEKDITLQTALLGMFSRCGNWNTARRLFEDTPERDTVKWTCMICSYAQNGHWLQALDTFNSMCQDGVMPSSVTFLGVLSSCSHAGLLDEGWQHFVSMRADYGLTPEPRHYICMLDLLARAGEADKAEELIATMPFEPDSSSWRSMMGGSPLNRPAEHSIRIAAKALDLNPQEGAPYVFLSTVSSPH